MESNYLRICSGETVYLRNFAAFPCHPHANRMEDIEKTIEQAGIKPTSNRILVLRELTGSNRPLSLGDLDQSIGTLEKSSILRTLAALQEHHLIHSIEDGRGVIKYEPCSGHHGEEDNDMHVHFYCEKCHKVTCFEGIAVPSVSLPSGFSAHSVNYMVKGICSDCANTA